MIFKRLFRVYAHIYHSHFQKIVSLGAEAHLNTCFSQCTQPTQRTARIAHSRLTHKRTPEASCTALVSSWLCVCLLLRCRAEHFIYFVSEFKASEIAHLYWLSAWLDAGSDAWAWLAGCVLTASCCWPCVRVCVCVCMCVSWQLIETKELQPLQDLISTLMGKDVAKGAGDGSASSPASAAAGDAGD